MIETERILLRPFVLEDAEAMYRIMSDPEVARYVPDQPPSSVEASREILRAYPIADYAAHGFGRWACVLRETGEVIGFCGLKRLMPSGEVDLGYRLARRTWGRGLATEGARASLAYGFEELALPEIIGRVMPENTASVRVLEKLGLERTGTVEDEGATTAKYVITRDAYLARRR